MPLTDRMEQRSHVAGSFVCPSCGESGKATKEHVIGQRFRREFPSIGRHVERFGNYSEPQAYSSPVNVDGRWVEQNVRRGSKTPELHNVQVKVCRTCNNGWMAALDDAVVPLIKRVSGESRLRTINRADSTTLTQWLYKIALAYDLFVPQALRAYESGSAARFFQNRGLPKDVTTYLGRRPGTEWLSFWQHGWTLAPHGTPDAEVVCGEPTVSTTFFAIEDLRFVMHRVSLSLPQTIRTQVLRLITNRMRFTGFRRVERSMSSVSFGFPLTDRLQHRARLAVYDTVNKHADIVTRPRRW